MVHEEEGDDHYTQSVKTRDLRGGRRRVHQHLEVVRQRVSRETWMKKIVIFTP